MTVPLLILASESPRRRELLKAAGVGFESMRPEVKEWEDPAADPSELAARNAVLKAEAVSRRRPDRPVLAADTTVYLEGEGIGKPADVEEARHMLRKLSGKTHKVCTGVAFRWTERNLKEDFVVTSRVTFRSLSEETISAYLARVSTLDKAGGYAIQEESELIIEGYEGSLSNIIGLPMDETRVVLLNWGLI